MIVPLLNGVDTVEQLVKYHLPQKQVLGGLALADGFYSHQAGWIKPLLNDRMRKLESELRTEERAQVEQALRDPKEFQQTLRY